MSRFCPIYVQLGISVFPKLKIWTLTLFPKSNICQDSVQCKKWQHFKLQWTEFGQALDFYVKSVSKRLWIWHRFDRDLTRLRQQLDKPFTWPISGLTLDRDLTMFGQRLDFLSSLCPTIHRQVVPTRQGKEGRGSRRGETWEPCLATAPLCKYHAELPSAASRGLTSHHGTLRFRSYVELVSSFYGATRNICETASNPFKWYTWSCWKCSIEWKVVVSTFHSKLCGGNGKVLCFSVDVIGWARKTY